MGRNVKNFFLLIIILLVVRWVVNTFFPVLRGLVDPLSLIILVFFIWDSFIEPLFKK